MEDAPPHAAPKFIAIAAMASNRVIGRDGKLPWHLPEDLKFFKRTTLGHPVLMGRRTSESILEAIGKPLPGRQNIVLSRTLPERADITVIREFAELAALPGVTSPLYLIGGAQLYQTLLPSCDEIILTVLDQAYDGDASFPPFEDGFELKEILGSGDGFEFRRYVRIPKADSVTSASS